MEIYNQFNNGKCGKIAEEKKSFFEKSTIFLNGKENILHAFKSDIFLIKKKSNEDTETTGCPLTSLPKKSTQGVGIKIITPKQIPQGLPTALVQEKQVTYQ